MYRDDADETVHEGKNPTPSVKCPPYPNDKDEESRKRLFEYPSKGKKE